MTSPDKRVISIDSSVSKDYEPNLAVVEIGLYGECEERNGCISEYNTRFVELKEALISAGVKAKDIINEGIKIRPSKTDLYVKVDDEYYRRNWKFTGFEYDCTFKIELAAPYKLLPEIWSAIIKTDEKAYIHIEYTISNNEKLRESLIEETVKNAQVKAQILANAAGMKLGLPTNMAFVSNVREGKLNDISYDYAECYQENTSIPEFNPDPITIRCNVEAEWEMLEG